MVTVARNGAQTTQSRSSYARSPSFEQAANGNYLRLGQRGGSIRDLKQQLAARGYDVDPQSDVFDRSTQEAVRAFQRDQGIAVDGLVGPQTLGKLVGPAQVSAWTGIHPQDADHHDHGAEHGRRYSPGRAPTEDERQAPRPSGSVRAGDLARAAQGQGAARTRLQNNDGFSSEGHRSIGGVDVKHPPPGATEAEQYDHYRKLLEASGHKVSDAPGQRDVLALRGMDVDGNLHNPNSVKGTMKDSLVVLWKDAQGNKRVRKHVGSTYPGQKDTRSHNMGVGMVTEGHYKMHQSKHKGLPAWHMRQMNGSGRIPGVRNLPGTNGKADWTYSKSEWQTSRRNNDHLTEVMLHRGSTRREGGVSSIGCINAKDWDSFVRDVGGASRNGRPAQGFNFTIINARGPENR